SNPIRLGGGADRSALAITRTRRRGRRRGEGLQTSHVVPVFSARVLSEVPADISSHGRRTYDRHVRALPPAIPAQMGFGRGLWLQGVRSGAGVVSADAIDERT